jgi:hypothetical protein
MPKGYLRNVVNEAYVAPIKEAAQTGDAVWILTAEYDSRRNVLAVYNNSEMAIKARNEGNAQDNSYQNYHVQSYRINQENFNKDSEDSEAERYERFRDSYD